jgi:hypothetical protein
MDRHTREEPPIGAVSDSLIMVREPRTWIVRERRRSCANERGPGDTGRGGELRLLCPLGW